MNSIKWLMAVITLVALLAGCGGGGGGNGGTIPTDPPGPGVNQAPVINSISPQGTSADPVRIGVNGTQRIVVAASDPDNDPLTYTWTTNSGTIAGTGTDADFTAPGTDASAIVTVKVSDGHSHTVQAQCWLVVGNGDNPSTNHPPVISSVTANPSDVAADGTSTLTAAATDEDGDTLTYTWSPTGGGIQSQSGNTAVWKAPTTTGSYTVTVSVSDGHNPAVTKNVAVSVGGSVEPPVTVGLNARYVQNSGKVAHPDLSKGSTVFTRIDPNINFDWGRKVPDTRLDVRPDGKAHDFGVIWTGYLKCPAAGVYNFRARYDDGFKMSISDDSGNMQTVVNGWETKPSITTGQITLKGNKWYKFEAQYFEDEDRCYVQLYWLQPGAADWSIIPTDFFRTK